MLRNLFSWFYRKAAEREDQRVQLEKELGARNFLLGLEAKAARDKELQQIIERGSK